ncbi:hypothetical protein [Variovorax sp. UC122_21]|uniref:hypothetical protein n=1 Tax=Variovorax sp. UC122_21 TaxID=3374554 RepID=UPI003757D74E
MKVSAPLLATELGRLMVTSVKLKLPCVLTAMVLLGPEAPLKYSTVAMFEPERPVVMVA